MCGGEGMGGEGRYIIIDEHHHRRTSSSSSSIINQYMANEGVPYRFVLFFWHIFSERNKEMEMEWTGNGLKMEWTGMEKEKEKSELGG